MAEQKFQHGRFGEVAYDPDEVIEFPGLPGFPDARHWLVRAHDRGSAFAWLIAIDAPALALAVANPWHFFPSYAPDIKPSDLSWLGAGSFDEVEIIAVATIRQDSFSLNLAAPIVIQRDKRKAVQVILDSDHYPLQALVCADGSD